jgi:hypothetical protein
MEEEGRLYSGEETRGSEERWEKEFLACEEVTPVRGH